MNVYEVIADPIRRRILELVSERERHVGELTASFHVSGPAVSRHLRVLREAGLVESRQHGTQRIYRLRPEPLDEIDAWIAATRSMWSSHLDSLETHLEQITSSEQEPETGQEPA